MAVFAARCAWPIAILAISVLAACSACDSSTIASLAPLGTLAPPSDRSCSDRPHSSPPGGPLYFSVERGETSQLHRVDPTGQNLLALTSTVEHVVPYGASPDGTRVVWVAVHDEADDLLIASPDGRARTPLAPSPGKDWYPKFSPDGAWILFESSRASFRDLYKVAVTGGEPIRLTDNPEGNFDAAWSPNGEHIAFASSRGGQGLNLFVMRADGSDAKQLTHHAGDSVKPAWSADGSLIAFISGRDGRDDLYVIRPDGTEVRNLTGALTPQDKARPLLRMGAEVDSFEWHPRERRIVLALRMPKQGARVYSVEADSGATSMLSGEDDRDSHPTWSPDGRWIAFENTRDGVPNIWIMRADGSRRARLTQEASGAWLPRWLNVREGGTDR